MTTTLRIVLIIGSLISLFLCITKIKQAKLKINNSVIWMIGNVLLIIMSIFSDAVEWVSSKLGFMAPANFVFCMIIGCLIIQVFIDNIRICTLNEKIKNLNHAIALKEYEKIKKGEKK